MTTTPQTPQAPTNQDPWTTRRLLQWMSQTFEQRGLDSPRLSAEILLSHVLECERLRLYMEQDRPASPAERETLRDLVKRALNHEPIQYLTGEARFFGLDLKADRRALIPRPSTETILEHVLQSDRRVNALPEPEPVIQTAAPDPAATDPEPSDHEQADTEHESPPAPPRPKAPAPDPIRVADICTGSGCIAVALAKNLPHAQLIATDISPDALALAMENAERHAIADRIDLREGDLLAPLAGEAPFDWILANPPYIPDNEWDAVEPNVKDHEPHLALRASPDGLTFVRTLIERARPFLAEGGSLMIELAAATAADAAEHARAHGWTNPVILKDHEDYDRVLLLKNS